jgi:hypothetical protein
MPRNDSEVRPIAHLHPKKPSRKRADQIPRSRLNTVEQVITKFVLNRPSLWGAGRHTICRLALALVVWLSGLTGIVIIHIVTTGCSRRRPRFVQKATQSITDPLRTLLFGLEVSRRHYSHVDIPPYFWVNSRPPKEENYFATARDGLANERLKVSGLVERPLCLTLLDISSMPKQTQITKHCRIQAWSGVPEWGGASLYHIVGLLPPAT